MEVKHKIQRKILATLLFNPLSKFTELNKSELDNNHFNFHLKQLINLGLVIKTANRYKLTPAGIEFAGRLDTATKTFPKQPKIGVCIYVERNGGTEILLGKRLKDPGKGIYYFFTKKLEYLIPILETAKNCLKNETGLKAAFEYTGNTRHTKKNYDVLFVCFKATVTGGKLVEKTQESENLWVPVDKISTLKNTFPFFKKELELFQSGKKFFQEFS